MTSSAQFKRWIEMRIDSCTAGTRMPSSRALAKKWHLSAATIQRTLASLAERGNLESVPGKGFFKPGGAAKCAPGEIDTPTSSEERLAGEFKNLICRGALKSSEVLPPVKFVSVQFKVAPQTVIRAYRRLEYEGLVTHIGKKYFVGSFEAHLKSGVGKLVYHITFKHKDMGAGFRGDWLAPAFMKMEHELLRKGYSILYESMQKLRKLSHAWLDGTGLPHGLIFTAFTPDDLANIESLAKKLRCRFGSNAPKILLSSNHYYLPFSGSHGLLHGNVFTCVTRAIARYILKKRYRHVALLHDLTLPSNHTLGAYSKIEFELGALSRSIDFTHVFKVAKAIGHIKPTWSAIYDTVNENRVSRIIGKYGISESEAEARNLTITREFESAFSSFGPGTLLLFAQDTHAIRALQWARDNRIRIPRDIGLITLENHADNYHHGLSAVTEDWDTIGYQMAHALIGDFPIARTSRGYIKPSALVLERLTT